MSDPYILGTRGSALALTQSTLAAEHIVQVFNAHSREHGAERTLSFDITTVKTDGDVLTGPLATLGAPESSPPHCANAFSTVIPPVESMLRCTRSKTYLPSRAPGSSSRQFLNVKTRAMPW